ncbi:MAG: hypothetical protein MRZ49_05435 [Lachnospiraceae bacterium]|nr:hypothetical protein [Lachnospiraceae bacterium]
MKEKLKEITERCFEGDLTLPKVTIWLIGAVCLLGGIVYGLKTAPMTHGMMIGSNNGNNNNGNGYGCSCKAEDEKEENENQEDIK